MIYLDAVNNKYIEEVSSCNFFAVKGKTIATPALGGSIIQGITRKSVIELAKKKGYVVEERNVSVEEVLDLLSYTLSRGNTNDHRFRK